MLMVESFYGIVVPLHIMVVGCLYFGAELGRHGFSNNIMHMFYPRGACKLFFFWLLKLFLFLFSLPKTPMTFFFSIKNVCVCFFF